MLSDNKHTVVVRVRQTRQIVCCQILVCHNSACLFHLLLMFLSAGRSDAPLSSRSSTAEVSDDLLSPRSSTAEVSEDSLRPRSSTAEGSEDSLRPRSSTAERAESILLPLSTASRRRAPFLMVRLIPVHIRFVSFSVEVLFQSAARFRGLKREGGRQRPPWLSGPPSFFTKVLCASGADAHVRTPVPVTMIASCCGRVNHYRCTWLKQRCSSS